MMHTADYDVVGEAFDYDLLRSDLLAIKRRCSMTYKEIAGVCGCNLQSVYKFCSGEYAHLGDKLRYRFVYFVRAHWNKLENPGDISKPRYRTEYRQHKMF